MDSGLTSKIDGVVITPLRQILDDRGAVLHMLRNDAALCDRDIAFQISAVAALHGFDAPAVFNVADESRLQSLPTITLDAFFDMVS